MVSRQVGQVGDVTARVIAVVVLLVVAMAGVVGLELAGRPEDRFLVLVMGIVGNAVVALLGTVEASSARRKTEELQGELHNGLGDKIADKTAERIAGPSGSGDAAGR